MLFRYRCAGEPEREQRVAPGREAHNGFAGLRAGRDFDARHQLVELEQGVSPPLPAPVLDGDGKRGGTGLEPERELLGRAPRRGRDGGEVELERADCLLVGDDAPLRPAARSARLDGVAGFSQQTPYLGVNESDSNGQLLQPSPSLRSPSGKNIFT